MQLFPLKSLVFVVHFLNAFWHGKETFPKSNSYNESAPLLIVFYLPYSKYKGMKYVFIRAVIKIKIFHSCRTRVVCVGLVLHSCRQCSTCVALVLHSCRSCLTRVAVVLLVLHSCCIRVTRVALVSLVSGTRVANQTRSNPVTLQIFSNNCLFQSKLHYVTSPAVLGFSMKHLNTMKKSYINLDMTRNSNANLQIAEIAEIRAKVNCPKIAKETLSGSTCVFQR